TGSRLYGTHYELGEHPFDPNYVSDYDTRGIFVAPATDFLPLFQQVPTSLKIENRSDCEVYEVRNFLMMASNSNPNIMDILFGSTNSLVHSTPIGQKIYENRHIFLSNQAEKSFSSYAMSQLHRMKKHYKWNKDCPEIYNVHDSLKSAFNNKEIDFQFIADYFSGDLAKDVTGQDANNKSHITNPLTLTQFKEKYLPNLNLNKFLKPHIFKFMTFKTILNKKIDNIDIELLFNQLNSSATFSMLNES
ncbi:nucleotidyltransferase domain-containing protein, partial [Dolichospermum sp. ST_con]|nr:nucleotidyltransferase domain-containing protein [Dolichospermum sp. ST_con]